MVSGYSPVRPETSPSASPRASMVVPQVLPRSISRWRVLERHAVAVPALVEEGGVARQIGELRRVDERDVLHR